MLYYVEESADLVKSSTAKMVDVTLPHLGTAHGMAIIAIGPKGGKIVGYGKGHKPIYQGSAEAAKLQQSREAVEPHKKNAPTTHEELEHAALAINSWLEALGFSPGKREGLGMEFPADTSAHLLHAGAHAFAGKFAVQDLVGMVGTPIVPKDNAEHVMLAALHAAGADVDNPFPDLSELKEIAAGEAGGSHGNKLFIDKKGQKYLFKPTNVLISYAEEAACRLGRLVLGPDKVQAAKVVQVKGVDGVLIPFMKGKEIQEGHHKTVESWVQAHAGQLVQHQVLDWLISNHDSHAGNFLTDGDVVKAIDKGQAWKFLGDDELAANYHPNPSHTVYNKLWALYQQKELESLDPVAEVQKVLDRIDMLTPDQFRLIVAPYAAVWGGTKSSAAADKRLEELLARFKSMRQDWAKFLTQMTGKPVQFKAPATVAKPEPSLVVTTPVPTIPKKVEPKPVIPAPIGQVPGWPQTKGSAKGSVTIHHPGSAEKPTGWPSAYPGPGFKAECKYKKQTYHVEFLHLGGSLQVRITYPDKTNMIWSSPAKAADSMYLFSEGQDLHMGATEKKEKGIAYPASKAFGLKVFAQELAAAHGKAPDQAASPVISESTPTELEAQKVVEPGAPVMTAYHAVKALPEGLVTAQNWESLPPSLVTEQKFEGAKILGPDFVGPMPGHIFKTQYYGGHYLLTTEIDAGSGKPWIKLQRVHEDGMIEEIGHLPWWQAAKLMTTPPTIADKWFHESPFPQMLAHMDFVSLIKPGSTQPIVSLTPDPGNPPPLEVPTATPQEKKLPAPKTKIQLPEGTKLTKALPAKWGTLTPGTHMHVILLAGAEGYTVGNAVTESATTPESTAHYTYPSEGFFKTLSEAASYAYALQHGFHTVAEMEKAVGKKLTVSGPKFWGLKPQPKPPAKTVPGAPEEKPHPSGWKAWLEKHPFAGASKKPLAELPLGTKLYMGSSTWAFKDGYNSWWAWVPGTSTPVQMTDSALEPQVEGFAPEEVQVSVKPWDYPPLIPPYDVGKNIKLPAEALKDIEVGQWLVTKTSGVPWVFQKKGPDEWWSHLVGQLATPYTNAEMQILLESHPVEWKAMAQAKTVIMEKMASATFTTEAKIPEPEPEPEPTPEPTPADVPKIHTSFDTVPMKVKNSVPYASWGAMLNDWSQQLAKDNQSMDTKPAAWPAWVPPPGITLEGTIAGHKLWAMVTTGGYTHEGDVGPDIGWVVLDENGNKWITKGPIKNTASTLLKAVHECLQSKGLDPEDTTKSDLHKGFQLATHVIYPPGASAKNPHIQSQKPGWQPTLATVQPETPPPVEEPPKEETPAPTVEAGDVKPAHEQTPAEKVEPVKLKMSIKTALTHHPAIKSAYSEFTIKASKKPQHTNLILKVPSYAGQDILLKVAADYGFTDKIINTGGKPKQMYGAWVMTVPTTVLDQMVEQEVSGQAAAGIVHPAETIPEEAAPKGPSPEQLAKIEKSKAVAKWAGEHPAVSDPDALFILAHTQQWLQSTTPGLKFWARQDGDKLLVGSPHPDFQVTMLKALGDNTPLVDSPLGPMFQVTPAELAAALPQNPAATITGPDGKTYPKGTTFETLTKSQTVKEALVSEPVKVKDSEKNPDEAVIKMPGTSPAQGESIKALAAKYSLPYVPEIPVVGGSNTLIFVKKADLEKPHKTWDEVVAHEPAQPNAFIPEALPVSGTAHAVGEEVHSDPLTELSTLAGSKPPRFGQSLLIGQLGVLRDCQMVARKVIDQNGKRLIELTGQLASFSAAQSQLGTGSVSIYSALSTEDPVTEEKTHNYDAEGWIKEVGTAHSYDGVRGNLTSGTQVEVITESPTFGGTFRVRIPENLDVATELSQAFTQMGVDPEKAMAPVTGKNLERYKKWALVRGARGAIGWNDSIKKKTSYENAVINKQIEDLGLADKVAKARVIQTAQGQLSVVVDEPTPAETNKLLYRHDGSRESLYYQLSQGAGWASRKRKYLQGAVTGGWSASADVSSGGAVGNFFRLGNLSTPTANGSLHIYMHPRALRRYDWFMHSGDKYGSTVKNSCGDPADGLSRAQALGYTQSNEVMFEGGLPLDDLMLVTVGSASDRKWLINSLQKTGITHIGKHPIEQLIYTHDDHAAINQHVAKLLKE